MFSLREMRIKLCTSFNKIFNLNARNKLNENSLRCITLLVAFQSNYFYSFSCNFSMLLSKTNKIG